MAEKQRAAIASSVGAIVPAFKLGRTRFYEFENAMMAPFHRVMESMVELECVSMRFTRAHLEAHFEMCDKYVTGEVGKDVFIKHLVDCYDRLTWASAPETIFRAMACWFFTKDESPYVVDQEYNKRKVDIFLRYHKKLGDAFFLSINSTRFPLKLNKSMLASSTMGKSMKHRSDLSIALSLSETHCLNKESRWVFPSRPASTNFFTGWLWR